MSNLYDADYFLHGQKTGKSLYSNYRWMPELTVPMVLRMIDHLGIEKTDSVLDFGCARGYTVKALRELGYEAYGVDVSEWAIDNCDDNVKDFLVSNQSAIGDVEWIIAKDVLEHVEYVTDVVIQLMDAAKVGIFAVVPLSVADGHPYVVPDYEKDVTHLHRLTLASWVRMFARPRWSVECSYRVPGIKENYASFEAGNGFIVARRL